MAATFSENTSVSMMGEKNKNGVAKTVKKHCGGKDRGGKYSGGGTVVECRRCSGRKLVIRKYIWISSRMKNRGD